MTNFAESPTIGRARLRSLARQMDWFRGLRAAVALCTPLVIGDLAGLSILGWAALGGFEAILADTPFALASLVDGVSAVGGGAAPSVVLPTVLVALSHPSHGPDRIAARLRRSDPPVVARVADDRLLLDLRTVLPGEEEEVRRAVKGAFSLPRG